MAVWSPEVAKYPRGWKKPYAVNISKIKRDLCGRGYYWTWIGSHMLSVMTLWCGQRYCLITAKDQSGQGPKWPRTKVAIGGGVSVCHNLNDVISSLGLLVVFWATVCKTVRQLRPMYRTVVMSCPVLYVCLSVTLVYRGQTVGWIKIPLSTEIGLGAGDILLVRDPAPPRKGAQQPPYFSAHVYCWPNCRPSQRLLSCDDTRQKALGLV